MKNQPKSVECWDQTVVAPGEQQEVGIKITESYASASITIPVYVWRGKEPGPSVLVTAAVHGDEINGTGIIHHLLTEQPFEVRSGSLVLVPVVNLSGFETHTRYLPDRRDLNRSFPGSNSGSFASRMARRIFDELVMRCDYGIDLHTAAVRRTNFPNIRADMTNPELAAFARAFGTELIVSGKGPEGSFRRCASSAGCMTLILEAGEVWKVEPTVVEYGIRGIQNCLIHLGMVEGDIHQPAFRAETDTSRWVRAQRGGFLRFHVAPGAIVEQGQPIATNTSLMGQERNVIKAPRNGIVLGMTTIPSVAPGDPVCHLAYPKAGTLRRAGQAQDAVSDESLHGRALQNFGNVIPDGIGGTA